MLHVRRLVLAASVLAMGLVTVATTGCELIGGIEQRSLGTITDAGSDGRADGSVADARAPDAGAEAGEAGEAGPPPTDLSHCTLAAGTGTGLVRFGNLVPNENRVDVCMRPSSTTSFSGIRPIFAGGGPACAVGLGYKDVTVSLAMPPDTYEVRFIPAGMGCDAPPVASSPSALVADKQPEALYLLGDGQSAPTLSRFVESRPMGLQESVLRLLHAAPDLGPLDFGVGAGGSLPSTLAAVRVQDVTYGQASPNDPSQTAVDPNGYVTQQLGTGDLPYVVAPSSRASDAGSPDGGSETALLLDERKVANGEAFTFFAVGRTNVPDFPLQLFGCDEVSASPSVLALCADAPAETFTVDTVDVQLDGLLFAPVEQERRPAALAAVGALTSDYVCVTNLYQQSDKDTILSAGKGQFPYSYSPSLGETTAATNPDNLAGMPYMPPSTPPCASSTTNMNALVDCVRDNCSTMSGCETAIASEDVINCLSGTCLSQSAALLNGNANDNGCFGAVLASFNSYETMASTRMRCTSDPSAGLSFRGASGLLMISRRPLTNTQVFVLPPITAWQTTILRATTTLDNGASVDLYCATGRSVMTDCTLAKYQTAVSNNADGTPAKDCIQGSSNEQLLYAIRTRDWVAATSGIARNRAILSGDFYSGPAYQNSIQALQPDNFGVLSAVFSLGTAASFTPECTDCATNPLRTPPGGQPTGNNTWTRFNLLQNIPITDVQSNLVFLKDPVVSAMPGNGSTKVPISSYYAFRSVLSIRP